MSVHEGKGTSGPSFNNENVLTHMYAFLFAVALSSSEYLMCHCYDMVQVEDQDCNGHTRVPHKAREKSRFSVLVPAPGTRTAAELSPHCAGLCVYSLSPSVLECVSPPRAGPQPLRAGEGVGTGSPPSQAGGATAQRRKRRRSGIVAAAGVVNQADEQRILLPGYFTTPGLHHTHPLQASLAGPGRTQGRGAGPGRGVCVCKIGLCSPLGLSADWCSQSPGGLSAPADACPGRSVPRVGSGKHLLDVPV
nr:uncharacterized protein LOC105866456 [Microcebus murinus]